MNRSEEEKDFIIPLTIIAVIVAILALVIAFTGAQSDGTEKSSETPKAQTASEKTSSDNLVNDKGIGGDKKDIEAKYFDPRTQPVAPGPKKFTLTATERDVKIGDKTYRLWTFNDTVPGPILRVVEGDLVTITVKNDTDSTFVHSVDHHSSRLTLGGGHIQVAPGKSGTYSFVAESPGVWMYHCATSPVLHHIGMGMYGMMIVQPKEGWQPAMPEVAIVQSELYGSTDAIDTKDPQAVVFNGVPNQYLDQSLKFAKDSNLRIFFLNAGPSELSSFHVVGTIFDRVYPDGDLRNVTYNRQALGVPSSGGGVFEMELRDEGQFPFVTHQFNHAALGATGMIIAGDGIPGPESLKEDEKLGHGHD